MVPHFAKLVQETKELHNRQTLNVLLLYTFFLWVVFTIIYRFWGLKHVQMPGGTKITWRTAAYYSGITQFSFTPPGEAPPLDDTARTIIGLHACLSYCTIFWILFGRPYAKAAIV